MSGRPPVLMVVRWVVSRAQATSTVAAVQAVMMATRQEHGCLTCSLSTEVGEGVAFTYRETWASEQDLRQHVESERFAMFAGLLESGVAPPQVEFALPSGSRGLDYAFEVRQLSEPGSRPPSRAHSRR